jgi:hypothetical protein
MEALMTIHLTDVAAASKDYVTQNVECEITNFNPARAGDSKPEDRFEFELRVKNKGTLPLTNVRYQISSSDGDVFQLIAPDRRLGSLLTSHTSPVHLGTEIEKGEQLEPGQQIDSMVVWPAGFKWKHEKSQLDPGETDIWKLQGKAMRKGDGEVKARILGDIDLAALAHSKPGDWVSHKIKPM